METKKPLCLYHANCNDGFTAAWLVWRHFGGDVDLHAVNYGESIFDHDVEGRDVYVVDFSYPREELLEAATFGNRIFVLDHHKSAQEALAGLEDQEVKDRLGLHVEFDMERSGAMMTWDFLWPDEPAPLLVAFVQDRDLWRWELAHSKEVSAYMKTVGRSLEEWEELRVLLEDDTFQAIRAGEAVLRFQEMVVEQMCGHATEIEVFGHQVLIAPVIPDLRSEVAGRLAEGRPFGIGWYLDENGDEIWSLRSREGGVSVREVAESFGGGGHENAAGCKAPRDLAQWR